MSDLYHAGNAGNPSNCDSPTELKPTDIRIVEWRPLHKNTLQGWLSIEVRPWGLVLHGLGVFEKNGRKWVGMPSKPLIKDGSQMIGDDGKPRYSAPLVGFSDRASSDFFSAAALAALAAHIESGSYSGSY